MSSPVPLPIHDAGARRAFAEHPRVWQGNRYVYPVLSRRSKGISIGINLNPDKVCNFDCIYCSVNRRVPLPAWASREVDLGRLREELAAMLEVVASGAIYTFEPFDKIPEPLRRVNDIAFSGDGEPTTCPQFRQAVELAAELAEGAGRPPEGWTPNTGDGGLPKGGRPNGWAPNGGTPNGGMNGIKLVLITNATMFHKPEVREVLAFLDRHNGEIWAKLDAGTAAYYDLVDRTGVPFGRVLENVLGCCQTRPTVIQTLLMRVHGAMPEEAEIAAYVGRLKEIRDGGGVIKLVQLYTVARETTEAYVTALTAGELEAVAGRVREWGVGVEVYP